MLKVLCVLQNQIFSKDLILYVENTLILLVCKFTLVFNNWQNCIPKGLILNEL